MVVNSINSADTTGSSTRGFTTINTSPVFTSTAVTIVKEGEAYDYTITTSDADDDYVTVSAIRKPDWLSLEIISPGYVTTLAGSGIRGNDDGDATTARFNGPSGVAIDALGNAYVADGNRVIRKIAPNGDVTTFAGSGTYGSVDGNGTEAGFDDPASVAVDATGNIYVSDTGDHILRKITPNGDVTTLAGSGARGGADGNGTAASFDYPTGIAADEQGNVYVADLINHKIRKIAPNGDVTTLAGSGSPGSTDDNGTAASFNNPREVAVDAAGYVYVADSENHKIRKIAPNGDVTTLAGSGARGSVDGNGSAASFDLPSGVAVDVSGNVYVSDLRNHKIRRIAPNGDVTTFAGSGEWGSADGAAATASFKTLRGVASSASGYIYVADYGDDKIRRVPVSSTVLSGSSSGQIGNHVVVLEATDDNGGIVQQQFTVVVAVSPTVSADAASVVSATGATLNGNVVTDGNATIIERGIIYAKTSDDANPTLAEVNGTTVKQLLITGGVGSFSQAITGLEPNSNYSYVAYATNVIGLTESEIQTFVTAYGPTSPVFVSTPITRVNEGDTYTYTVLARDADDDEVTVTATTKPDWLSLMTKAGGDVTTVAGSGQRGTADGNGSDASFYHPYGIVVDAVGNVYVADNGNYTIRKITADGDVTTLAGAVEHSGFNDANGTRANFSSPSGLAMDGSGNLYVADARNSRIRKIDPQRNVTTLAGSDRRDNIDGNGTDAGFYNPRAIALDSLGNFYIGDTRTRTIRKIAPNGDVTTLAGSGEKGSADGNGTAASFNYPTGIAVDKQENVYVADMLNHLIRKISPNGDVTTLAGSGSQGNSDGNGTNASFNTPTGCVTDDSGNLYVADQGNHSIRRIAPDGEVTTFTGFGGKGSADGNVVDAGFDAPNGIALDPWGNLYVTEAGNNKIRRISATSLVFTGNSSGQVGDHPVVLEANDGNGGMIQQDFTVIVADLPTVTADPATTTSPNEVTIYADVSTDGNAEITERGVVYSKTSDDETPSVAEVNETSVLKQVVTGTTGSLVRTIRYLEANTSYSYIVYATNRLGTTESSVHTFTTANTLHVFSSSAMTYVNESENYEYIINTYDVDGDPITVTAPTKPDWLRLETKPGGEVTTLAGSGEAGSTDGNGSSASFNNPSGVAVDASGNVYVADRLNHKIRKITPDGRVISLAGSGERGSADGNGTDASFISPTGVAVDASGNLYVTDQFNRKIRKITPDGAVTTLAGSGEEGSADGNGTDASFGFPAGIAVDASGTIYVTDRGNDKIRKISPSGDVSTLAGSWYAGDQDGLGTLASFNSPYGIAVDRSGYLYVAGEWSEKIRKITPDGYVTTVAGQRAEGSADGNGTEATFSSPTGIAVDASGNLYVADRFNRKIRKITPNGDVTTLAGSGERGGADGNGTNATFNTPVGVAVSASGNLYVAGGDDNKIRKISTPSLVLTGDPVGQSGDHSVVLDAHESNGGSVQQSFIVRVINGTDLALVPPFMTDFKENGSGTALTVRAVNNADVLAYSLGSGNDESFFSINSTSGVVTFNTPPDFENPTDSDANNTYVINVIASDGINSANQDVTITVSDVDEIAPSISITSDALATVSGVFTVTVEYSEVVTGFEVGDISVTNGTVGNFTSVISGQKWTADITPTSDGEVTVNVAAATATDVIGNENTAAMEFSIVNDETAPTVVLSSGATVAGVYTVTAQFSESVSGFALADVTITGGTAGNFTAVDADTYTFTVSSANASASVDIAAGVSTDAAGNGNTAATQLTLSFNNAPTDINLSNAAIDENNESGDLVGNFSTIDADATDSHAYSLVAGTGDTDNAAFTLDAASLKAAEAFDFETKSSYSIRVRTDDGRGGTFEKNFTISIENVGEPKIELSGDVSFTETQLGITASTPITITNTGEVGVEVVVANAPADFSVTPGSVILMAGESKQVNVNFTPSQEATYSGNLIFAYEDQQVSMPVSGIGTIITAIDDEFTDPSEIGLYPNPVSKLLNIDLSQVNVAKLDITIINAAGTRIYGMKEYRKKQLSINVGHYSDGVYIVEFKGIKSVVRKKVIIRK